VIARTPEDVDRLFGERVNAGDLDGLVELYEADATLVTADAGTLVGRDAIRSYFTMMVAIKMRIDMGSCRVVPMGADLALVHHDWHATMTMTDGQELPLSGKATEIVRRQPDGRWLFLLDDPDMRG
jgi:uncharacterized protein (TIGR02246 family)